jgi:Tol biopolymer transport system component
LAGRATLILLPLIVSACTGNPATTAASSTSSAPTASATSTPAGYRVVFTASTTGGSEVFLYDSASSAPQQLVSLGAGVPPDVQFISSQKIAYTDSVNQAASRIVTFDLSTRASTTDVTAFGYVPAFAYSHDGSMLAYLVHDMTGKAALHVRRNGQESTLNLNPIPGRGTGRDDEVRLEYGPDDKYLLMVDTFVGNQGQAPETGQFLVLRTTDNAVAFVPPSGVSSNATMATWARRSDRLYYRDQVGVRTWDAGSTRVGTLATALHWYDPAVSPDDRWIAYTEIDAQFVSHVRLFDLQRNQTASTIGAARSHPIFITADLIWYLEEQPCQSECLGGPSQTSGKVLAYNLKSKSDSALPFSDVHSLSQLAVPGR